jgi:hypothetical protein
MRGADVLELLRRSDKHYLGSGAGAAVVAPKHPVERSGPGFRDGLQYFHWWLVPAAPAEPPVCLERVWRPSGIEARWRLPDGREVREQRVLLPGDVLHARFEGARAEDAALLAPDLVPATGAVAERLPGPVERLTFACRHPKAPGAEFRFGAARAAGAPGEWTFAVAPTAAEAAERLARLPADPVAASRAGWAAYFDEVPTWESADRAALHHWWHRWFGLRLFTLAHPSPTHRHPCVAEGNDSFHLPISYSAPAHMRELRWRADDAAAWGEFLNFAEAQKPDGSFWGFLRTIPGGSAGFYHADWGGALLDLYAHHPRPDLLPVIHGALARYAEHFRRDRDPEGSRLYDVFDQYETGQEYSPRYTAVAPDADREEWVRTLRLKAVDATVYVARLYAALCFFARLRGKADESEAWARETEEVHRALCERMWDRGTGMFSDVDPATGARTGVRAAVSFYPYLTTAVSAEHLDGLKARLLDPAEFWTPFPVATLARSDPAFSAEGLWKGERKNCPWNGRVWPMVNSHLVEALFFTGERLRDQALVRAGGELLRKFVSMMCWGGDPARPNAFEHYHPDTGEPSAFRGVDDYQHSWTADLLLKYAAGVRVRLSGAVDVRPQECGFGDLRVSRLRVRGWELEVEVARGRFHAVARRDGERREASGAVGEKVRLVPGDALLGG